MSALDQAFIKAFAKEPATTSPARRQPAAERVEVPRTASSGEPQVFDELYDAGTFYRVDAAKGQQAVPASHLPPERKVPRRLQRRSAQRQELQVPEPPPPAPVDQHQPLPLPPRRNWSKSMLEIARQLARLDLMKLSAEGELPPEIVFSDPPVTEIPTAPVLPTPAIAPPEQVMPREVAAPQPVPAAELELPPSAPHAIANFWSVDAPIVAQSALLQMTDAETWLALPMAPAVTCYENVMEGWSRSAEPAIPAPTATEPATGALAVEGELLSEVEARVAEIAERAAARAAKLAKEKKAKRKLRIDGSHKLAAPHVAAPVVETKTDANADEIKSEIVEELVVEQLVVEEVVVEAVEEVTAVAKEIPATVDAAAAVEIAPVSKPIATEVATAAADPVAELPVAAAPVVEVTAPVAEAPVDLPAPEPVAATIPKRPYVPLWEVDRFTWPALCDKLMHDPSGYFASASNKLLNVVRGGLKVLGITGSRRGEGRTTLALCLARAAAQAGIHVALVDADFSRPQLATMLGLETAYGWQEAATGKIPLSEAAVKSLADRLTVLPLEVTASSAPLSLADPRVTATLRATAATFDLVIVDLGPLGSGSEPLFPTGENCPLDAAVVVRDTRFASVNESRVVGDRLYEAGIEAVGIAENFVTQPELAFL
jgi:Mrp family chromosome partitioning ATPase